ncbi:MAG: HNH endonuclease signature motif containing protein [Caldisericia bacterium]|nr:HNH endonuclease signature motif containing protein [Caldisericia bacterium]
MKDILNYNEVVTKEGFNVQRGMNYRPQGRRYSILLMSVRENSPYNDGFDEKGEKLMYEGEDVSRREKKNPKEFDQPLFTKNGKLTNNGLFFKAAEDFKYKRKEKPELVRVYEKISNNVWSDKGWFKLVDAEFNHSSAEKRKVFKFILLPEGLEVKMTREEIEEFEFSRRIPTEVKRIVWERDNGKCSHPGCDSKKDLHFDHIIPWSKGGSSRDPKNIQILCGKHNLKKSDKII